MYRLLNTKSVDYLICTSWYFYIEMTDFLPLSESMRLYVLSFQLKYKTQQANYEILLVYLWFMILAEVITLGRHIWQVELEVVLDKQDVQSSFLGIFKRKL